MVLEEQCIDPVNVSVPLSGNSWGYWALPLNVGIYIVCSCIAYLIYSLYKNEKPSWWLTIIVLFGPNICNFYLLVYLKMFEINKKVSYGTVITVFSYIFASAGQAAVEFCLFRSFLDTVYFKLINDYILPFCIFYSHIGGYLYLKNSTGYYLERFKKRGCLAGHMRRTIYSKESTPLSSLALVVSIVSVVSSISKWIPKTSFSKFMLFMVLHVQLYCAIDYFILPRTAFKYAENPDYYVKNIKNGDILVAKTNYGEERNLDFVQTVVGYGLPKMIYDLKELQHSNGSICTSDDVFITTITAFDALNQYTFSQASDLIIEYFLGQVISIFYNIVLKAQVSGIISQASKTSLATLQSAVTSMCNTYGVNIIPPNPLPPNPIQPNQIQLNPLPPNPIQPSCYLY